MSRLTSVWSGRTDWCKYLSCVNSNNFSHVWSDKQPSDMDHYDEYTMHFNVTRDSSQVIHILLTGFHFLYKFSVKQPGDLAQLM